MPARERITKSRGKAKIKVSEKRLAVMNKILESYSEEQASYLFGDLRLTVHLSMVKYSWDLLMR